MIAPPVLVGHALRRYAFEAAITVCFLPAALLAAGHHDALRQFLANSIAGAALNDAFIRAGVSSFWVGAYSSWKSEDGHHLCTCDTWLLILHGLVALLDDHVDTDALRAWLPSAAELLYITEYECLWRALGSGQAHPALLCARLHGEKLGDWALTAQVVQGVLKIEQFNPLLRVEAHRLLGRAYSALGQSAAACEQAAAAVAEAEGARYVWLEQLASRDEVNWREAGSLA